MNKEQNIEKEIALECIITSAIQIQGVKVERKKFLLETFYNEDDKTIQEIVNLGPIEAKISQEKLTTIANKLILKRTSQSSLVSFATGIPGGLAMAATIPTDVLQFFGMSLRLAQELSYLYGAEDLWNNGQVDDEKIKNQLLLYCGVMFGVSGAVSGVRVLSTQIAKTTLKKLPQKALTKTFWYPIIKKICAAIGVKITKTTVAQGVSKTIPIIGGVISGSLNFASMMPMANRLQQTLDSATFSYSQEDLENDINEIEKISLEEPIKENNNEDLKNKIIGEGKKKIENISRYLSKIKENKNNQEEDAIEMIKKLSELKDNGIITQEEFDKKKTELLKKL